VTPAIDEKDRPTSGDYEAAPHVKYKVLPLRRESRAHDVVRPGTFGVPESTIRDHPRIGVAGVGARAGRKSIRRGQAHEEHSQSQTYAITALGQPEIPAVMCAFAARLRVHAAKECVRYSVVVERRRFSSK
jgi:hypothetical protein